MGTMKRSEAREYAFKLIYEATVQREKDLAELISDTEKEQNFSANKYISETVAGVSEKREELDTLIADNSHGWKLSRISVVSGAIMRLAIYEMLYGGVPFSVAINEAVELAKRYDHEKAPKFINGILNSIAVQKGLKAAPSADAAPKENTESSDTAVKVKKDEQ